MIRYYGFYSKCLLGVKKEKQDTLISLKFMGILYQPPNVRVGRSEDSEINSQ